MVKGGRVLLEGFAIVTAVEELPCDMDFWELPKVGTVWEELSVLGAPM